MSGGWDESASAWIADMERGSFGREQVLDPVMLRRVEGRGFAHALDVGCGEGRFCRMMQALGVATVGIDPTPALLDHARAKDPGGAYRKGVAERLDFPDGAFDLVVSYLSLIDIPDIDAAIPEMARVLKPGGSLLIANLNGFRTAAVDHAHGLPSEGCTFDHYLQDRAVWVSWRGIRVQNWHRPLSRYMALLLGQGLRLAAFEEPAAAGGDPAQVARQDRAPWFHVMEWVKA